VPDAALSQGDHRGMGGGVFLTPRTLRADEGSYRLPRFLALSRCCPPPEMKMLKLLIFLTNYVTTFDFDVAHDISENVDQLEHLRR